MQSGSRFGNSNVVLAGRYVLLGMLGKGGFSEVFKVRGTARSVHVHHCEVFTVRGREWGCLPP